MFTVREDFGFISGVYKHLDNRRQGGVRNQANQAKVEKGKLGTHDFIYMILVGCGKQTTSWIIVSSNHFTLPKIDYINYRILKI